MPHFLMQWLLPCEWYSVNSGWQKRFWGNEWKRWDSVIGKAPYVGVVSAAWQEREHLGGKVCLEFTCLDSSACQECSFMSLRHIAVSQVHMAAGNEREAVQVLPGPQSSRFWRRASLDSLKSVEGLFCPVMTFYPLSCDRRDITK